ncbi:hypothetical protein D9M72_32850 [compost metagenome]
MNDIDSPDFAKARGFLIGFSSVALVLWFYGVDLTTIKFFGLEVVPRRNANHSWGIIAIVTLYLCFRFYQRMPEYASSFDTRMNAVYDQALGWVALAWYRSELYREGIKFLLEAYPKVEKKSIRVDSRYYTITCHQKLEDERMNASSHRRVRQIHELSRVYRTTLTVSGFFIGESGPRDNWCSRHFHLEKTMPAVITWSCKTFALARGVFVTPWFTDNWLPLVLGAAAVGVAMHRWLAINAV